MIFYLMRIYRLYRFFSLYKTCIEQKKMSERALIKRSDGNVSINTKASPVFVEETTEPTTGLFTSQLDVHPERSPMASPRQHIERKLGEIPQQQSVPTFGANESYANGLSMSHRRRNHRLT